MRGITQSRHSRLAVPMKRSQCIGLRSTHGRPQNLQRHRVQGVVDGLRDDGVTIVDEEPVSGIQGKTIRRLLDRPVGSGVSGDVPVHDTAAGDVEDDEQVHPLACGGHHQEVAREHRTRMIVQR